MTIDYIYIYIYDYIYGLTESTISHHRSIGFMVDSDRRNTIDISSVHQTFPKISQLLS